MNSAAPDTIDWHLVRAFLAAYEEGSLLAAARKIRSTQPTVGRHIAELERQLDTPLFERTGRGLLPTHAAHAIADAARKMEIGANELHRAVCRLDADRGGTVRISASHLAACYLLPPIVAKLRVQEPAIAIEVVASNELTNLLRREADIAVRMVRPTQESLIARKVATVPMGIYGHPDYLLRRGSPTNATQLLEHDLIGLDTDDGIIREFRAAGIDAQRENFPIRSDDHIVRVKMLNAGLGIGFVPTYVETAHPELQRILPGVMLAPVPLWLAVHREIRSSPRIRLVYDFLATAIAETLT